MIPKSIKLLFSVPFVIIVCYTVYLVSRYNSIPAMIPIHGYSKNTGGLGSKIYLFFPIVLNLIILSFVWLIIRKPDNVKFSFEIKEEDKAKTYYILQLVLVILAIFVTIVTTLIMFSDVVFK